MRNGERKKFGGQFFFFFLNEMFLKNLFVFSPHDNNDIDDDDDGSLGDLGLLRAHTC
jgi:hypothetical protein